MYAYSQVFMFYLFDFDIALILFVLTCSNLLFSYLFCAGKRKREGTSEGREGVASKGSSSVDIASIAERNKELVGCLGQRVRSSETC